ncbi:MULTISPECIES: hypothetical protein [unclassified Lactobacillus]|nr:MULTISPECIES: hypothetical protein [unclassified Lactobacillus]
MVLYLTTAKQKPYLKKDMVFPFIYQSSGSLVAAREIFFYRAKK